MLVAGVLPSQLLDLSSSSPVSPASSLRRVVFPAGEYELDEPLMLDGLCLVSDLPVVLTCGTCQTSSEVQ